MLQFIKYIPKHNTGTYCNVKRVFGTELWNFNRFITQVYNLLLNTLDLISKDKRQFLTRCRQEIVQRNALLDLLDGNYGITLLPKGFYSLFCRFKVFPFNAVLSAKGCFMDLFIGRYSGNSAQAYLPDKQCI